MKAIYPHTSNHIWSVDLGQPPGPLLIADDLLLLSTRRSGAAEQSATLHALSLTDGDLHWRRSFEHAFISGLATTGDNLILVSLTSTDLLRGEGVLLALGADGEEHWRWTPEESVQRVSAPAVTDNTACFTVDTHTLVVLDLANGEAQAAIPLEASASLSAPVLTEDAAYIPCRGPHLLAVGLDGEMRWHFTAEESDAWLDETPVVIDKHVFAVSSIGTALALHTEDGSLVWRVEVGPAGKPLSAPATDGERLYVGARDGLYALALADGDEVWHFPSERRVEAAPVVHAGVVYATCHDHHLYALDAASGENLWRYETDRRIEVAPALAHCGEPPERCVIVADRGGTITAVVRPLSAAEHEAQGHWLEAAKLREALGQREHAAELYEKAGAWQEAAALWCNLDRPLKQAKALEQYAHSLGEMGCSDTEQAAAWQAAARAFEAEGERDRVVVCRREVARCLRLPIITLDVEIGKGLVLDAWSRLRFIVRNEGFGPARNLIIRATGEQFEGQVMETQQIITLKDGQQSVKWLDVCPREPGDSVPLRVRADYEDRFEEQRFSEHTIYIPVARSKNTRRKGQTINVFVSGGGAAAVGDGAVAAGGGSVAVGGDVGGDVSLGARTAHETTSGKRGADSPETASLRRQLAKARENLRLIEERKAEYVLEVEIPLQLIKEERRLQGRIAELETLLGADDEISRK